MFFIKIANFDKKKCFSIAFLLLLFWKLKVHKFTSFRKNLLDKNRVSIMEQERFLTVPSGSLDYKKKNSWKFRILTKKSFDHSDQNNLTKLYREMRVFIIIFTRLYCHIFIITFFWKLKFQKFYGRPFLRNTEKIEISIFGKKFRRQLSIIDQNFVKKGSTKPWLGNGCTLTLIIFPYF